MTVFSFIYRSVRAVDAKIYKAWCAFVTVMKLKGNQVTYGEGLVSNGIPVIDVHRSGKMTIGANFNMNNGRRYNIIGRQQPCCFVVRAGAELTIGNNTGISAVAIVCAKTITIGDNVKIGGNTVIYDTDFHSLDHALRADKTKDAANAKNASVNIGDNAFIGAHATILKGVTIGEGAIIGASSVVTTNVPPFEIWAGNPAKFVKKAL